MGAVVSVTGLRDAMQAADALPLPQRRKAARSFGFEALELEKAGALGDVAAVEIALEALTRDTAITITTDSAYVKNGVTTWIHNWKKNGWKTAAKKPVKNVDLWQRLDEALAQHEVEWFWVKGHAGHPENERADELARNAIATLRENCEA